MRPIALIVEDDPGTRHELTTTLAAAGIDCIQATTSAAMWQQFSHTPDIVILELNLPDCDGLGLLRELRQTFDTPVLVHSTRTEEIENVIGVDNGANDFLVKPGNPHELVARVRNLLRRAPHERKSPGSEGRRLRFGDWTLDTATRQLSRIGTPPQALGVSAHALLLAFLERPFETLSREHLSRVLNREYTPYDRIIDVHVSQIRRTLGIRVDGSSFIKTLRSQGYVFIADVETLDPTSG